MSNELKKSQVGDFYDETQKEFNGEFGVDPFQEEDEPSKGALLIYDLQSAPVNSGLDMEKVIFIFKEHQVVLYDSFHGGDKPQLVNVPEGTEIKVLDIKSKEGKQILNKYKDE